MKAEIKPILLISASDSSAAAGMQVDLRVLDDLGAPARCAVTAVTVQGDTGARSINPVDPDLIVEAINSAMDDAPGIGAVKVGLLGHPATVSALRGPLSRLHASGVPVVVDPVMRSTPGSALSAYGTPASILEEILGFSTLVTPNRQELEVLWRLTGRVGGDETAMAEALLERGLSGVLVTGGDTEEKRCRDILYRKGPAKEVFDHPRIGEKAPRGTGCALSTAIAVHLAGGMPMAEAIARSIQYVTGLISRAAPVGNQLLLFPGKGMHGQ